MITVYTAAYFLLPLNAVRLRKRSGWTEPMAVLLANEGIATHHPNQKSLFYWSKIQKVLVSGNRLFLFTTPNCAIILPRHCFSDDAQFENWSERAAERWRAARTDAAG